MSEESDVEKTEDPTPHRREKARKDGQIARSKELVSLMMLLGGWALLWLGGSYVAHYLAEMLRNGLYFDHRLINDQNMMLRQVARLITVAVTALLPLMLGLVLVAACSPAMLGGFLFSGKSIKVDIKRLNPFSGLKRIFSMKLISEMLKTIFKVCLVGTACGIFIWHNWPRMMRLTYENPLSAMADALSIMAQCLLVIILSLIPMVAYDIVYQLASNAKKLRMSRQEIRDEHKQQDGDPMVKNRIRQQQRHMAQQRMMADVPKADVIVNNPTHYSVALKYEAHNMSAPTILAKGAGVIAMNIRAIAEEHRIPMLEAAPLARALYRHGEIGQQIPTALYGAVAQVLAWVYGLRRWRKEGGLIPKKPKNLTVPGALDFAQESTNHGKSGH
ncbi:flagellar biosynthesis protein FlhB [Biostraticola tofi]|uniref:Flagellar biosynthetic protein FlhB n=1 Tax=Biostraticola tofi TaxID=466109 RepID=A0A4R3YW86_9GAMM|nr:flagellar biosynthesis protein FlhB [Biostraticola tofi]TCV95533.1 flagellar biosynthetic protein FlhB [Biostraticola tofi]